MGIGDILLRPAPETHPGLDVVDGHLHPSATLRDGKLRIDTPHFGLVRDAACCPSTGLAASSPEKDNRVAILMTGGVLMMQAQW